MTISTARTHQRQVDAPGPLVHSKWAPEQKMVFWHGWLSPIGVERLVMAVDAVIILCSGLLTALAYHWFATATTPRLGSYFGASALVAVNFVLVLIAQRAYQLKSIARPFRQVRMAALAWCGVFAALLAVGFTLKVSEDFSRGATISFFAVGFLTLFGWKIVVARFTAHALRAGAFANTSIVVIAEQGLSTSSAPLLELRQHGYRPARILEISSADLASPIGMSLIQPEFDELVAYAREHKIEQIFLLFDWGRQHVIDSLLDALKILPISVHLIPDASVARYLKYPTANAGGAWTTELRRAPLTRGEQSLKRLFDLVGASTALLLFAPIMLAAALLVKATSNGPVLFRQTRNGFNGRAFRILKFRSMTVTEDGPKIVQATKHDRRVTPVGRWLRKTSIDELPQLFNVLRGEMSLVGPRPHAAAHNSEYEQLIGNYAFRHHVKPGITGWAQINGYRGETNTIGLMEKRVELDLWYINNWSVWLDLNILLKTTLVGFRRNSAY